MWPFLRLSPSLVHCLSGGLAVMYFGLVQFERLRLLRQLECFRLDFAGLQLLVLLAFGRLVQFGLGLLGVTHLGSLSIALGLDVAQL